MSTRDGVSAPWVGFDLDGTLAHHPGGGVLQDPGEPIKATCDLVRNLLANGDVEVKIFTARVCDHDADNQRRKIKNWCLAYFGQELEVTNAKDYNMIAMIDDRAIGVVANLGQLKEPSDVRWEMGNWGLYRDEITL